jgi:hypothetical protein
MKNEDAIDSQSHMLHCVIHCNGYGHLVSLGIEVDSSFEAKGTLGHLLQNMKRIMISVPS